eukprot:6212987-Pleurochrysis_carterae.AAC.3
MSSPGDQVVHCAFTKFRLEPTWRQQQGRCRGCSGKRGRYGCATRLLDLDELEVTHVSRRVGGAAITLLA